MQNTYTKTIFMVISYENKPLMAKKSTIVTMNLVDLAISNNRISSHNLATMKTDKLRQKPTFIEKANNNRQKNLPTT